MKFEVPHERENAGVAVIGRSCLGDLPKANSTMIQRIFVGLTRLQPNRKELSARQRDDMDRLVRRLAAYRARNPARFSGREPWWLERLDGWVAALPAE